FPNHYEGPAGKVDGSETLKKAICRETLEEEGLVIKEEDLSLVHVIHRLSDFGEYFEFYFLTDKYDGQPEIKEPDLCDDIGWFDINSLPQNMVPKTKEALDRYKKGEIYSESGWQD
ncbi:MAG: NUDIX domain-containing protein, partial [Nitrospira sp.]